MTGSKSRKEASGSKKEKAEETKLKRKSVVSKDVQTKKRQARKERKAKKDPNKPKRPPSAFFVFLEEFRKTYKAENPTVKAVAAVGKAGGDKWKAMSAAEKAPYVAKAEKRKAEYDKLIQAYNKKDKSGGSAVAEESDKSRSEINDEDEEEEESGEDEEEE